MGKKKDKKVIQMSTSPESYIKTRARHLPLGKCYINKDWEESGFASIIISRKHVNGNFTFGVYLVDLYCLGVKDTIYDFNVYSPFIDLLDKFKEEQEAVEIEYTLAHNIIYGAVEYAEDIGFKPHKDFEVSKYLLEEDDDRIELIDIEFGLNGKPAVLFGNEMHPDNVIATLERNVGKGNFIIINREDLEDEDEDFEDDEEELTEENIVEILVGKKQTSPRNLAKLVFVLYTREITEKEKAEIDTVFDVVETWEMVDEDELDEPLFFNSENEKRYETLLEKVALNPQIYLSEIEDLIATYPDEYYFHCLLCFAYQLLGDSDMEQKSAKSIYAKFPKNIFAFVNYILLNVRQNFDQLEDLIGSEFELQHFFPGKDKISYAEFASLINALFVYFLVLGEKNKAIAYAMTLTPHIFYGEGRDKVNKIILLAIHLMLERGGIADDSKNQWVEEIDYE